MQDNNNTEMIVDMDSVASYFQNIIDAIDQQVASAEDLLGKKVDEKSDPTNFVSDERRRLEIAIYNLKDNSMILREGMGELIQRMAGLQSAIETLTDQRDEALSELQEANDQIGELETERDDFAEQLSWAEARIEEMKADHEDNLTEAYFEGQSEAAGLLTDEGWINPDELHDVMEAEEEDFVQVAQKTAEQLRQIGHSEEAEELERLAVQGRQMRKEASDRLMKGQSILWQQRAANIRPPAQE